MPGVLLADTVIQSLRATSRIRWIETQLLIGNGIAVNLAFGLLPELDGLKQTKGNPLIEDYKGLRATSRIRWIETWGGFKHCSRRV